jgi:hypothetical protein
LKREGVRGRVFAMEIETRNLKPYFNETEFSKD